MTSGIGIQIFPIVIGLYGAGLLARLWRRPRIMLFLLGLGFTLHTLFIINRSLLIGIWIPNPLFETVFFLPWCLALISLGLTYFSKDASLSEGLLIPIVILSLATLLFPTGVIPPGPKTQTIFSVLFFMFEVLGQACFIAGSSLAILNLIKREPARIFHSFLVWGFIFYSIAQVLGAYWAYLGWATPLHWSNRHLQSASLWCFYAALLHLRYRSIWNLKTEARFSLFGLFLVLLYGYGGLFTEAAIPRIGG